ncbi:MAG: type II secretion system F family protein [Verrucomicrobiales bacterium]|nr:type II secretion system F family protein [Verrucomicrobiales bacterium]
MGFSNAERAQVYYEFAKLVGAGFGIDKAADTVLAQDPVPSLRIFAQGVKDGLGAGKSVAESVRALPLEVTELEWRLVEAGEKGGRLEDVFEHLAHYFDMVVRGTRQVRQALIYPAILLHMGVVLPALPGAFVDGIGGALVSVVVQLLVVYAVVVGGVIGWNWSAKRAKTSARIDGMLKRIPMVGKTRVYAAMNRFCKVFEICLLSGQKVSDAVNAAGGASGSGVVVEACGRIEKRVIGGDPVGPELLLAGEAFPREMSRSLSSAEEAGALEKDLRRWAALMRANADEAMERLAVWMPKVIYAVLLLLVAYQVVNLFFTSYLGPLQQLGEGLF